MNPTPENENTTPETTEETTQEQTTTPAVDQATPVAEGEGVSAAPATEEGIRTNTAGDADIDEDTHSREVAQNMKANGLSSEEDAA